MTIQRDNKYTPDPIDQYLKDVRITPLLTRDQEFEYAKLAQSGNSLGRKKMIEGNLRLVIKIAKRYIKSGLSFSDLIEEGNLGLIHAVEKFDPDRGFRFSTYAAWWIQQTIERGIMNQAKTIRLPVYILKKVNRYLRNERHLHNTDTLEEPTPQNKPFSLQEIEQLLMLNDKIISIDAPISLPFNTPLLETLQDLQTEEPYFSYLNQSIKKNLHQWLEGLPEKEHHVIIRRYGLMGHDMMTLDETGQDLGLTRERIRQIQTKALRTLKKIIQKNSQGSTDLLN